MGLVKLSYLNSAVGAHVKVDMTAAIKVLHSLVAWTQAVEGEEKDSEADERQDYKPDCF